MCGRRGGRVTCGWVHVLQIIRDYLRVHIQGVSGVGPTLMASFGRAVTMETTLPRKRSPSL